MHHAIWSWLLMEENVAGMARQVKPTCDGYAMEECAPPHVCMMYHRSSQTVSKSEPQAQTRNLESR
jgi:hypothetical protein